MVLLIPFEYYIPRYYEGTLAYAIPREIPVLFGLSLFSD